MAFENLKESFRKRFRVTKVKERKRIASPDRFEAKQAPVQTQQEEKKSRKERKLVELQEKLKPLQAKAEATAKKAELKSQIKLTKDQIAEASPIRGRVKRAGRAAERVAGQAVGGAAGATARFAAEGAAAARKAGRPKQQFGPGQNIILAGGGFGPRFQQRPRPAAGTVSANGFLNRDLSSLAGPSGAVSPEVNGIRPGLIGIGQEDESKSSIPKVPKTIPAVGLGKNKRNESIIPKIPDTLPGRSGGFMGGENFLVGTQAAKTTGGANFLSSKRRGRGRPPKHSTAEMFALSARPKRKRGRPRKKPKTTFEL